MNIEEARKVLNINISDSSEIIKKKYREQALKWHPDRNPTENTTTEFQRIQSAYELLSNKKNPIKIESYKDMLFSFLKENLKEDFDYENLNYILQFFIKKIKNICEKKAICFLENLNPELFSKIYFILLSYKDLFYLSDNFFIEIKNILDKKVLKEENRSSIIIHPTIDDLFENNLYKIIKGNHTFLVPLWHHNLVYDNSGIDLNVKCFPILPDGITIDENNNIDFEVMWNINEIWDKTNLFIYIGSSTFYILREQLLMKSYQIIRLYNCGISRINTIHVYDVRKKGDIILHIHLVL
jgi:molecular chaperone DnaJ